MCFNAFSNCPCTPPPPLKKAFSVFHKIRFLDILCAPTCTSSCSRGRHNTCTPSDWILCTTGKKSLKKRALQNKDSPYPTLSSTMPLLATETKVVVFSDFDGTITFNDSNGVTGGALVHILIVDYMTDNLGFGAEKRLALNDAVLDKSRTFRWRGAEMS